MDVSLPASNTIFRIAHFVTSDMEPMKQEVREVSSSGSVWKLKDLAYKLRIAMRNPLPGSTEWQLSVRKLVTEIAEFKDSGIV